LGSELLDLHDKGQDGSESGHVIDFNMYGEGVRRFVGEQFDCGGIAGLCELFAEFEKFLGGG